MTSQNCHGISLQLDKYTWDEYRVFHLCRHFWSLFAKPFLVRNIIRMSILFPVVKQLWILKYWYVLTNMQLQAHPVYLNNWNCKGLLLQRDSSHYVVKVTSLWFTIWRQWNVDIQVSDMQSRNTLYKKIIWNQKGCLALCWPSRVRSYVTLMTSRISLRSEMEITFPQNYCGLSGRQA